MAKETYDLMQDSSVVCLVAMVKLRIMLIAICSLVLCRLCDFEGVGYVFTLAAIVSSCFLHSYPEINNHNDCAHSCRMAAMSQDQSRERPVSHIDLIGASIEDVNCSSATLVRSSERRISTF